MGVECVSLPSVPVVLHPGVVAGNGPRFQLKEIVLVANLPIGLAHTAPRPVFGGKGQARAGVRLPALELGDELRGVDVVAAAHVEGDGTVGVVASL